MFFKKRLQRKTHWISNSTSCFSLSDIFISSNIKRRMTRVLFIDNGVEFDSLVLREKPFGGAEVAFVSLVESLAKLGLKVTVYNNCINEGLINGVKWKELEKNWNMKILTFWWLIGVINILISEKNVNKEFFGFIILLNIF